MPLDTFDCTPTKAASDIWWTNHILSSFVELEQKYNAGRSSTKRLRGKAQVRVSFFTHGSKRGSFGSRTLPQMCAFACVRACVRVPCHGWLLQCRLYILHVQWLNIGITEKPQRLTQPPNPLKKKEAWKAIKLIWFSNSNTKQQNNNIPQSDCQCRIHF